MSGGYALPGQLIYASLLCTLELMIQTITRFRGVELGLFEIGSSAICMLGDLRLFIASGKPPSTYYLI